MEDGFFSIIVNQTTFNLDIYATKQHIKASWTWNSECLWQFIARKAFFSRFIPQLNFRRTFIRFFFFSGCNFTFVGPYLNCIALS